MMLPTTLPMRARIIALVGTIVVVLQNHQGLSAHNVGHMLCKHNNVKSRFVSGIVVAMIFPMRARIIALVGTIVVVLHTNEPASQHMM
jgi:hypothetical protein